MMSKQFITIKQQDAIRLIAAGEPGSLSSLDRRWLIVGIPGAGKTEFLNRLYFSGVKHVIDADKFGKLIRRDGSIAFIYDSDAIARELSKRKGFAFAAPGYCVEELPTRLFNNVLFLDNDPKACYLNRVRRKHVNHEPGFPLQLENVIKERESLIQLLRSKFAAFEIYTVSQQVTGETGRSETNFT